jgi:hypothetical protein
MSFLETHENIHVESHRNKLLIYKRQELLSPEEIKSELEFAEGFIKTAISVPLTNE